MRTALAPWVLSGAVGAVSGVGGSGRHSSADALGVDVAELFSELRN
jgi:hypothetical protein